MCIALVTPTNYQTSPKFTVFVIVAALWQIETCLFSTPVPFFKYADCMGFPQSSLVSFNSPKTCRLGQLGSSELFMGTNISVNCCSSLCLHCDRLATHLTYPGIVGVGAASRRH